MDTNNLGVYLGTDVWREMLNFTNNAVVMVFASEHYDEKDYIRDYEEFHRYLEEKKTAKIKRHIEQNNKEELKN